MRRWVIRADLGLLLALTSGLPGWGQRRVLAQLLQEPCQHSRCLARLVSLVGSATHCAERANQPHGPKEYLARRCPGGQQTKRD